MERDSKLVIKVGDWKLEIVDEESQPFISFTFYKGSAVSEFRYIGRTYDGYNVSSIPWCLGSLMDGEDINMNDYKEDIRRVDHWRKLIEYYKKPSDIYLVYSFREKVVHYKNMVKFYEISNEFIKKKLEESSD